MKVIEKIGEGGFGIVEKCELPNGEIAARKTFIVNLKYDPDINDMLRKRFIREVNVLGTLDSNYFTPVLNSDLECDNPWYLMPLAAKNFKLEIVKCKSEGTTPWEGLFAILESLIKLHEAGYCHRDLKPDNVLLFGQIWKLADFGFISAPEDSTTTLMSSHLTGAGTLLYMAPEQEQKLGNATHLSDIYSFGCILHDCFGNSPRLPFQRHTVPGKFNGIVQKCTELLPEDRFESVTDLKDAIESILNLSNYKSPGLLAQEWINKFQPQNSPSNNTVRNFFYFIMDTQNAAAVNLIFSAFNTTIFDSILRSGGTTANEIAKLYCKWSDRSFSFDECNKIADNLYWIYNNFDVNIKALATIATAILGSRHSRWYVMKKVAKMCDNQIDEDLCDEIIGLVVVDKHLRIYLRDCIKFDHGEDVCHPKIAKYLSI